MEPVLLIAAERDCRGARARSIDLRHGAAAQMLQHGEMDSAAEQNLALASREHGPQARERELAAVIQDLLRELHPQRPTTLDVTQSSRLERDLGIDSLGRTKLILRVERAFDVRLAGRAAGEAETVGEARKAVLAKCGEPDLAELVKPAPPSSRQGGG